MPDGGDISSSTTDGGHSSLTNVVVIGDMSKAKSEGTLTEADYNDKKKFLFEKQAYEAGKLENDLHSQEAQTFNEVLAEFEEKKENVSNEMAEDFKEKLKKAQTEAEKDRVLMDYAASMAKLTDELEKQKQRQLAEVREKMLERRRRHKKDLHNKHIAEAQGKVVQLGFPITRRGIHDFFSWAFFLFLLQYPRPLPPSGLETVYLFYSPPPIPPPTHLYHCLHHPSTGNGISADEVPDIPAQSHQELDHELKILQNEQERLGAEVRPMSCH